MRLPNGRRARMDMWGHNPFGYRKPRLADPPLGDGFVDFGTLDTFARKIDRYQRKGMKLFLSEYTIPTEPEPRVQLLGDAEDAGEVRHRGAPDRAPLEADLHDGLVLADGRGAATDGLRPTRGLMTYRGVRKPSFGAFKRG